jgi:predicted component of type VI protein secretion system
MRAALTLSVALFALALIPACNSMPVVGGYDPADPVTVKVVAPTDLNTYSGGSQPLDLYFARVSEALTYEGTEISELRVTKEVSVPGGRSIKRFTVSPGETVRVELGPMVYDHFTHVGVFAAYGAPSGESGSQIRAVEIPRSGKVQLLLGANGIQQFEEDDD